MINNAFYLGVILSLLSVVFLMAARNVHYNYDSLGSTIFSLSLTVLSFICVVLGAGLILSNFVDYGVEKIGPVGVILCGAGSIIIVMVIDAIRGRFIKRK